MDFLRADARLVREVRAGARARAGDGVQAVVLGARARRGSESR